MLENPFPEGSSCRHAATVVIYFLFIIFSTILQSMDYSFCCVKFFVIKYIIFIGLLHVRIFHLRQFLQSMIHSCHFPPRELKNCSSSLFSIHCSSKTIFHVRSTDFIMIWMNLRFLKQEQLFCGDEVNQQVLERQLSSLEEKYSL